MPARPQATIALSSIKVNPDNPRLIKDANFKKLLRNILHYPKFLELRPIVHMDNVTIGGNMRLQTLHHIIKLTAKEFTKLSEEYKLSPESVEYWQAIRKAKEIPGTWVKDAAKLSEDERRAFIIIDNRPFGEDDLDKLANQWNIHELTEWGVDTHKWGLPTDDTKEVSFQAKKNTEDYVTFEQVMHHLNKTELTNLLDDVRTKKKLDKLEDALMHIVRFYKQNYKDE